MKDRVKKPLILRVVMMACALVWLNWTLASEDARADYLVKQGSFNKIATTGNQTVSNVGFQPKGIIFYWKNENALPDDINFGVGFAADNMGTKTQSCVAWGTGDNSGAPNRISLGSVEVVIVMTDAGQNKLADQITAKAEFLAFTATGFTLDWYDNDGGTQNINYIAFGGSDISRVETGIRQPPSSGTYYVDVGWRPSFVMFASSGHMMWFTKAFETCSQTRATPSIGFASRPDWQGGIGACFATDNLYAKVQQRTDQAVVILEKDPFGTDVVVQAHNRFVRFTDTTWGDPSRGFQMSADDGTGGFNLYWFAILGGAYRVGSFNKTSTSPPTTQDVTVGFQPKGLILASSNQNASTAIQPHGRMSFGASDGSSETAIGFHDVDGGTGGGGAKSLTDWREAAGSVLTHITTVNNVPPTIDAEASVSFLTDGFRLSYPTYNNAEQDEVIYVAFAGNGATVVSLDSFSARGDGHQVVVEWETKTEIDNLGFNLYRSTEREGTYTKLNSSLIPGLIRSVRGRRYNFTDGDVTRGKLYYYKLEDIDLNGTRTMHGPVCVDWDSDGIPDDVDPEVGDSDSDSGGGGSSDGGGSSGGGSGGDGDGIVTRVELRSFRAQRTKDGVVVEWKTGYEVDNLGFHLYREVGGEVFRLTPELIAGSALLAGSGTPLTAGRQYRWWDTSLDTAHSPLATLRYWLEDVDLSGKRTLHGPVMVESVGSGSRLSRSRYERPRYLSELGKRLEARYEEFWRVQELKERLNLKDVNRYKLSVKANNDSRITYNETTAEGKSRPSAVSPQSSSRDTFTQQSLAGGPAVKILVRETGWYRVSRSELQAAGLNRKANPEWLHLYAEGVEVPLRVVTKTQGRRNSWEGIEFYGMGLDTPWTDTRVYWLVEGTTSGRRVKVSRGKGGSAGSPSFPYTVELRDRVNYFANLRNGEASNFFGPVVSSVRVDRLVEVGHLDSAAPGDALLEVWLQGVTGVSHRVKVLLNEVEVGEVAFWGQSRGSVAMAVSQSLLLEGDNLVSLEARGGEMDVSLVDAIRLTYWHTYGADGDELRLRAEGREQVTVDGFSDMRIRVIDITEPEAPVEVLGKVMAQEGGYGITFRVPGSGQRTLLAFTEERVKVALGVLGNKPSSWSQGQSGYDMVMISHRDFLESLGPLGRLRKSQGLRVALVDIEDLYDEFSFGARSPWAIKDFLTVARAQWSRVPRFVLLVGDASVDPRNYLGYGDQDYVPTKLIDTAYLETSSDDWFVDFDNDGLGEVAIGRLPVQTVAEAETVVSKIVGYRRSGAVSEALLVADQVDPGDYDFEGGSDQVGALLVPYVGIEKVYRGRFGSDGEAKEALLGSLSEGPLLVNYMGHGSVEIWRGNLLTTEDAGVLINGGLPFFVNMTCLNGYFQDVYGDSMAEVLLKGVEGGAVAVWTSSGLTVPGAQAPMNQELINLLFSNSAGGESLTLGEAAMRAKAATTDQDVRKTWILFGDPATRLRP